MDDRPEHPCETALHGVHGNVRFARVADGGSPAKDFWDELTVKQQAKFAVLFERLTNTPTLQLANRQQFSQVEGDLWEFKRNDLKMRIFTFRDQNTWWLVSGLTGKKENALPPGEVGRAQRWIEEAKDALRKLRDGAAA